MIAPSTCKLQVVSAENVLLLLPQLSWGYFIKAASSISRETKLKDLVTINSLNTAMNGQMLLLEESRRLRECCRQRGP